MRFDGLIPLPSMLMEIVEMMERGANAAMMEKSREEARGLAIAPHRATNELYMFALMSDSC